MTVASLTPTVRCRRIRLHWRATARHSRQFQGGNSRVIPRETVPNSRADQAGWPRVIAHPKKKRWQPRGSHRISVTSVEYEICIGLAPVYREPSAVSRISPASAGAEGSRQNMTSARRNRTAANHAQVTLDSSSRVGRVERVPPSKVVHRPKMVGLAPLGPPYHYACSAPIPVRAAKLSQQKHCQPVGETDAWYPRSAAGHAGQQFVAGGKL